jgi:hypothetical protein
MASTNGINVRRNVLFGRRFSFQLWRQQLALTRKPKTNPVFRYTDNKTPRPKLQKWLRRNWLEAAMAEFPLSLLCARNIRIASKPSRLHLYIQWLEHQGCLASPWRKRGEKRGRLVTRSDKSLKANIRIFGAPETPTPITYKFAPLITRLKIWPLNNGANFTRQKSRLRVWLRRSWISHTFTP